MNLSALPNHGVNFPKRVLILEDNMIIGADLGSRLNHEGFCIQGIVSTGEEVLKVLRYLPPDILLMDIHLRQEFEGIEMAWRIRINYPVPILFVSAMPFHWVEPYLKLMPNTAFLAKPFDSFQLKECIKDLIKI